MSKLSVFAGLFQAQKSSGKRWTEQDDKNLNYFRKHYIPWLDKIKMADKEHPWDKYRPAKYQDIVQNDRDR